MEPIVKWESNPDKEYETLHWWKKLDNRYLVEVRKTEDPTKGLFLLFDHKENTLIKKLTVYIIHGDILKPDYVDLDNWEYEARTIIDELNKKNLQDKDKKEA